MYPDASNEGDDCMYPDASNEGDDDICVEEWYSKCRKRASALPPSGIERYLGKTYRRMKEQNINELSFDTMKTMELLDDDIFPPCTEKVLEPARRRAQGVMYQREQNGDICRVSPTQSLWYSLYCCGEENGFSLIPGFAMKFRKRFRMPYGSYLDLVQLCDQDSLEQDGYFRRWRNGKKSYGGQPCAPLQLLVLTSLRYLGRGWTFDDLEECTATSAEVIRVFFHCFISFGSDVLFREWVSVPVTVEAAQALSTEYSMAGFPGCVGSMDATHVECARISYKYRQDHLSFKMPFCCRTYNIVTNHRRRILSTTEGHPARWNDKTLVKFDLLATSLHEGTSVLKDFEFELCSYDADGNITEQKYKGAWLLVDNGYLNWAVTVPPMKNTDTRAQLRFSKWLESMRKDVECTFGILKGRWRVLKAGVRLHGTKTVDSVWKTCCALHNWLLEVDGLDNTWHNHRTIDDNA